MEKIFYLLENYLEILACCQVSDRCPLGYLFSYFFALSLLCALYIVYDVETIMAYVNCQQHLEIFSEI